MLRTKRPIISETEVTMSKTVLLGVTGSIAAYKTAELASSLKKMGYNVHVLMTENATNLSIPLPLKL